MNDQPWQPRFFTFWTAQAFSLFGSSLAQFALVWWLTETTGSATVLALSTLVALLPGIVIGPFAGVLVDRWDRRLIIAISDAIGALVALALAVLYWVGVVDVWHVLLAMFIRSVAGAFQFPAVQSVTPMMVPQDQLARVNGLNQMLQGLMQIVAPPLGALLLAWVPIQAIMGIDVVTAAVAVGLVLALHLPRLAQSGEEVTASTVVRDFRAGIGYVVRWPALFSIFAIGALLNLMLVPAMSLLPIMVTRHFGGDAPELAWLNSAFGIGIVVGGITLGVWGGFKRRIRTATLGLAGMGVGVLLIAVAPPWLFGLAVAGMFVAGTMAAFANGPIMAILQSVVAPEMQGRVVAAAVSLSMATSPLGLLVAGPLADWFGAQTWFLLGGIGCFAMSVVIVATPAIVRIEDGRGSEAVLAAQG